MAYRYGYTTHVDRWPYQCQYEMKLRFAPDRKCLISATQVAPDGKRYCARHLPKEVDDLYDGYQCNGRVNGGSRCVRSGTIATRIASDGKRYCHSHKPEESTMDKKSVIEARLEQAYKSVDIALRALEHAEALEAAMPKEPEYEEGNTAIVFRKQFQLGGLYYTYAAVAVEITGIWDVSEYKRGGYRNQQKRVVWYVSGSKTWQGKQVPWAELMEWLMAGEKWEVWQVAEFSLLGASDNV